MESGYDGLMAAEKKFGAKIKVKYIENVKFGDMEQVLVALAGKNELVIGVGGQTQASVFKVAPRRSEEQTSELQSLMRNTYAGLCWQKKKQKSQRRVVQLIGER